MEKRERLYEGKAKILYTTDDPDLLVQHFKDDATAFNRKKTGTIQGKGEVNCRVSSVIFRHLHEAGLATHYVDTLSPREMLVRRLDIVPIEVVVRNVVAGSLARRYGRKEGDPLSFPILELFYKSDELDDPMMNEDHVIAFDLASEEELAAVKGMALYVNKLLCDFFAKREIRLVDFKLEFGRHKGAILLGDEITPDGCRLWDASTGKKLDKDRFRFDLGDVEEAYLEVLRRVES